jgi:hypothetical protein
MGLQSSIREAIIGRRPIAAQCSLRLHGCEVIQKTKGYPHEENQTIHSPGKVGSRKTLLKNQISPSLLSNYAIINTFLSMMKTIVSRNHYKDNKESP